MARAWVDNVRSQINEVQGHLLNRERWLGKRAVPTATLWGSPDSITPFRAISGANTYGTDVDDEAKVVGTGDLPLQIDRRKFDLHRLLITGVSSNTHYKLRIICGSGTMLEAIGLGEYSEIAVKFDAANPTQSAGSPIDFFDVGCDSGADKVWIQAWNATDNATIDFLVGLHEYNE